MHLKNPAKIPSGGTDTCADIDAAADLAVAEKSPPDVRDIVLLGGCAMIVNGCVITVPPRNHNDTGRRMHMKKGRDNHLPGRGERRRR